MFKGIKHTVEARQKMSEAKLKNPVRHWKGKRLSEETKKKLSEAHKGLKYKPMSKEARMNRSINRRGENNHFWKGGITPINKKIRMSLAFRFWREAVFKRDNYTCQKYGTRGGKLHPHHVQNFADFPELRFSIDNGITLSEEAHREFHKKYGKKNNTRKQLHEFLKDDNLEHQSEPTINFIWELLCE